MAIDNLAGGNYETEVYFATRHNLSDFSISIWTATVV
jgi:hypothetical protein